jgi:hypothetical protein
MYPTANFTEPRESYTHYEPVGTSALYFRGHEEDGILFRRSVNPSKISVITQNSFTTNPETLDRPQCYLSLLFLTHHLQT